MWKKISFPVIVLNFLIHGSGWFLYILCYYSSSDNEREKIWGKWLWCVRFWFIFMQIIVVQSLRIVWLFATPWTAARQASLSFTISQSLLKLVSIESVIPSNHLILCHSLPLPSIFPNIRVFSNKSNAALCQNIGASASASASVLPVNIHSLPPDLPPEKSVYRSRSNN